MKGSLEPFGASVDQAPIETPSATRPVKGYHVPLRMAFEWIRANTDRQTADQECLQPAVFAINCTVGAERLCPALSVLGSFPRPARKTPAPSKMERGKFLYSVRDEVEKEQARRKIAFGLK